MIVKLLENRSLVFELAKREFSGRYKGSFGGILWSFVQPLFLLTVYTIAFGMIMQARWATVSNTSEYALMLFSGLIVFNMFSECLNKSPTLVTGNPNFVKKVVFPLELLPVITVLAALLHALIGVAVWLAGYIVIFGTPNTTVLLFPLVLFSLAPVLLGIGWLFASLGVIARDLTQLTGMLSHTLLFLTPIFYSIEAAPAQIRDLLMLNPLTFVVEQFRQVLFYGALPNWSGLILYFISASIFSWFCYVLFNKIRPFFADMV